MPHIQPIGKNLSRLTVKSERTRAKLSKLPGAIVDGQRVIVPRDQERTAERIVSRIPEATQLSLFQ
jgi:hypothetical protein